MTGRFRFALIAAMAVILGMAGYQPASADTIELGGGWAADVDPGVTLTPFTDPNDPGVLKVVVEKLARFTNGPTEDGYIEPLRITFFQVASQAATQISITDEVITNNTGVDWSGFKFIVETDGMGPDGGPKINSAASAGFDTSPFTTSAYSLDDKVLDLGGGSVANGSIWTPGLSGGELVLNTAPFDNGNFAQAFVFKEQPLYVIPLPASAALALSGLVGLGLIASAKKFRGALA
jgi:hypothetical protein